MGWGSGVPKQPLDGFFITAQNQELWSECNEETIKLLTKCRARETFNYPQELKFQNLEFSVDLNMPGNFSVELGFWRVSLEMQEGLGALRRWEKQPAALLSSVVWWQSSGRSPGLGTRSPLWDGISVINLGRKPMWLWPLPVPVDPVVPEILGRRSPGMHRSPVTLKRDEWNSRPQLHVIHKWTQLWLISVICVIIRQDIHSQSSMWFFFCVAFTPK